MSDEGRNKIKQLKDNAAMFRRRLKEMGCHVLGDDDSPIVPVMLYSSAKIPQFSRGADLAPPATYTHLPRRSLGRG